jgi:proton-coupled amino acid transporter
MAQPITTQRHTTVDSDEEWWDLQPLLESLQSSQQIAMGHGLGVPYKVSVVSADGGKGPLYVVEQDGNLVSSNMTMMNMLRAQIAAGALSLGTAFKTGGLWVSLALCPVIGLLNIYYGNSLVYCSDVLCEKTGLPTLDYGHVLKKAFDNGPKPFQKHGKKALYVCNCAITLYQIGVASVNFSFVVWNIQNFLEFLHVPWIPEMRLLATFMLPVFLCVSQISKLNILAYFSSIGNILFIGGIIIVMQYIVQPPNHISELPPATTFYGTILFCGTLVYTFEGQAMILPMKNQMREPSAMVGWSGVLSVSTVIMGCSYVAFGFFGYVKFGDGIRNTLTLNMPKTLLYQITGFVVAVAVFLGYPLQLYIIPEMLWRPIKRKLLYRWPGSFFVLEKMLWIGLTLISYCIVLLIPDLSLLMSVTGVGPGIAISMLFPPVVSLLVYWDQWTVRQRWLCGGRDLAVMAVGCFFLTYGTYAGLSEVVKRISLCDTAGQCP